MSATQQRDRAMALARTDPATAREMARRIPDPWFRAQALAAVARFSDGDPMPTIREAEKAAEACDDDYGRSAVRAWEIAALAERGCRTDARKALVSARATAARATPASSRAEALTLLLAAAARLGVAEALATAEALRGLGSDRQCERAVRDAAATLAGLDAKVARDFAMGVADESLRVRCLARIAEGGAPPRAFFGEAAP